MNSDIIIPIHTKPSYEVRILGQEEEISNPCREVAAGLTGFLADKTQGAHLPKIGLFTDDTVLALYGNSLLEELRKAGLSVCMLSFPSGEETKSLASLERGLEFLAKEQFTRTDLLVALGGGVVGDLTGFIAATYLRGLPFVQIPTTLLAAVDSSVGGKTAVNLKAGKNLAGAFHQPALVLVHPGFLTSLSENLFLDGLAEVIKCGCIGDLPLLHILEREDVSALRKEDTLTTLVDSSIRLKAALVQEDELDTGSRRLLNFGHTLGHAIEGASGYKIPHGHAVASGMYLCTKAAYLMGWTKEDLSLPLKALLEKLGYTTVYPLEANRLYEFALKDKKRTGDTITLVVEESRGHCTLKELPLENLKGFIAAALS